MRGRPSLGQRDRLDAEEAAVLRLPAGADTEQGKDLGDIIAVRAHGACAPDADADAFGVAGLVLEVALEQFAGKLLANVLRGDAG